MVKKSNINKKYKGNSNKNYYSFGSGFKSAFKVDSSALGAGVANAGLGMASNLVGGIAGGALSGGMSSGAGDAISGLSSIASSIPGPYGAIAGAGLQVVGGLVNRAFGSKMNEQKIAEITGATNQLANYNPNANSLEEFTNTDTPVRLGFTQSDVGKDGLFSNKAKNKYNELLALADRAVAKSNQSIRNNLDNLLTMQTSDNMRNLNAFGGNLLSNGAVWNTNLEYIGNGGTHEENPYEGVQKGIDPQGIPNLVEEGETIYNDYVFSNRLTIAKDIQNKYKLGGELTYADASKKLAEESKDRPNDPISQNGLEALMVDLQQSQEEVRQKEEMKKQKRQTKKLMSSLSPNELLALQQSQEQIPMEEVTYAAKGGKLGNLFEGTGGIPQVLSYGKGSLNSPAFRDDLAALNPQALGIMNSYIQPISLIDDKASLDAKLKSDVAKLKAKGNLVEPTIKPIKPTDGYNAYMRYAKPLQAITGIVQNAFSDADYSGAERIENTVNNMTVPKVTAPTISQKLKYEPIDPNRIANQKRASNAAIRESIKATGRRNNAAATQEALLRQGYIENLGLGEDTIKGILANQQQEQAIANFNRATDTANAESIIKASMANQSAEQAMNQLRYQGNLQGIQMREAIDAQRAAALNANINSLADSLAGIGRENTVFNMINSNPAYAAFIANNGQLSHKGAKGGYLTIKGKKRRKK